jgi:hypothetical protein
VPWATVDPNGNITFAPNDESLFKQSPFKFSLTMQLSSYPEIRFESQSFMVEVKQYACDNSTVYTPNGSIPDSSYTINPTASPILIQIPSFSTSPYSCAETISYSLSLQNGTNTPSFIAIKGNKVQVTTSDLSQAGSLPILVTIQGSEALHFNFTFTLKLVDPCFTTKLKFSPDLISLASAVNVTVGNQVVRNFNEVPDSATNTTDFCGPRRY